MKWSRAQERLRAGRDLAGRLLYRHMDAGIAAAVTLLALAVYAFAVLQGSKGAGFSFIHNVELRSLDARFRMRGARPVDPRVVIVGIDENTLQKVGAYPIPRNAYAGLISKLKEGGAPVIAMDMTFPLSASPLHRSLSNAMSLNLSTYLTL